MPDSPLSPEVKVNLSGLDDPSQPFFSPGQPFAQLPKPTPLGWLKENVGPIIAILVVIFGFLYLFLEIWHPLKNAAAIVGLVGAVVYFYYGSSKGSQDKDATLAKQLNKPGEGT